MAGLYKADAKRVVVFGMKTKFGGGSSQGFGLVYDDEDSQKKFEPTYRLVRVSQDRTLESSTAYDIPLDDVLEVECSSIR